MLRPTLLLVLAVTAGACGDRSLNPGPGDAGAGDSAVRPDGGGGCTADTDCVVAVRTDDCCEPAYPELASWVKADPCLELWSAMYSAPIPQACLDKWNPQCALIDCMPAPPPSRLARCAQGRCEFAEECSGTADCVLVVDSRQCCPCPLVVPARLLSTDPCLVKYPQGGPAPVSCTPQACPAMPCPTCAPVAPTCVAQTCESGVR